MTTVRHLLLGSCVLAILTSLPAVVSAQEQQLIQDLRGKWKKNIEAYRWFYATYGTKMSRRGCANFDPGQFETNAAKP